MIYAAGSASFEATLTGAPTGLLGTLGVRIIDGQGADVLARTTTGIVEHPAGSGIYTATLTAPAGVGTYVVVWDRNGVFTGEDLTVTSSAPLPPPPLTAALTRLRMMSASNADPVLSDEELNDCLARNALLDDDERGPLDADWTPTYAMGAAAQDAWLLKAGKVAHRVTGSDGSLAVTRSDLHAHCVRMAELYSARRMSTVVLAGVGGSRQRDLLPVFNSDAIPVQEPWEPGGAR